MLEQQKNIIFVFKLLKKLVAVFSHYNTLRATLQHVAGVYKKTVNKIFIPAGPPTAKNSLCSQTTKEVCLAH